MRGSRKFCHRGPNLITVFFLVDEGIYDLNAAINGPLSARQRNAIKMAFRWRADVCPTLNLAWLLCDFQGIRTSMSTKPYIL